MDRNDVAYARRRLWALTFTVIGALVAGVVYLAGDVPVVSLPDFLPSRGILGLGLIATAIAFMLYATDAERKLARLTERLIAERAERILIEEQEADQRDVISLTAHELRTPLTVIKGYVATLASRDDAISPDRRSRYLAIVNDQADRLADLVDDLMEVSRIESGRLRLASEPIDLPAVLRSLAETNAKRWGGRVVIEADATPPIAGDLRRIEEIVLNLIDNALKYSRDVVVVTARDAGASVEIAVSDTGPGIAEPKIGELFQKFHRLPEAVEAQIPGTGLGLYIVRAFAEAHGGSVSVDSAPGTGSTFTVRLPAAGDATALLA